MNRRRGKEDWEGRRRGSVAGGGRRDGALAAAETKERAADPALRQAIVILATSCRINKVIRSIPKKKKKIFDFRSPKRNEVRELLQTKWASNLMGLVYTTTP